MTKRSWLESLTPKERQSPKAKQYAKRRLAMVRFYKDPVNYARLIERAKVHRITWTPDMDQALRDYVAEHGAVALRPCAKRVGVDPHTCASRCDALGLPRATAHDIALRAARRRAKAQFTRDYRSAVQERA